MYAILLFEKKHLNFFKESLNFNNKNMVKQICMESNFKTYLNIFLEALEVNIISTQTAPLCNIMH